MPPYFYVLDAVFFLDQARPALETCSRRRTFSPLADLLPRLTIAAGEYSVLAEAAAGLPFDRHVFQAVVGQVLIFGASALPRLPVEPASVAALAGARAVSSERAGLAPIQQVFAGTRDLLIAGKPFRPLHVGWNDRADVARLSRYLASVDPGLWSAESLRGIAELPNEEERAEELALIRDWWPELVNLYQHARDADCVVVCETM
jgi:hypothetical protein